MWMLKKVFLVLVIYPAAIFLGPQPLLLDCTSLVCVCVWNLWCTDMQCDSLCWSGDRFGSRVTRTWNGADSDFSTENLSTQTDTLDGLTRCIGHRHVQMYQCVRSQGGRLFTLQSQSSTLTAFTVQHELSCRIKPTHLLTKVFHCRDRWIFINNWTNKWPRQLITHPRFTLTWLMYAF